VLHAVHRISTLTKAVKVVVIDTPPAGYERAV